MQCLSMYFQGYFLQVLINSGQLTWMPPSIMANKCIRENLLQCILLRADTYLALRVTMGYLLNH